jgi:hypothetical protein
MANSTKDERHHLLKALHALDDADESEHPEEKLKHLARAHAHTQEAHAAIAQHRDQTTNTEQEPTAPFFQQPTPPTEEPDE